VIKANSNPSESLTIKDLELTHEVIWKIQYREKDRNQGTHTESSMTRQLEGSMFNLLAASRNLTSQHTIEKF